MAQIVGYTTNVSKNPKNKKKKKKLGKIISRCYDTLNKFVSCLIIFIEKKQLHTYKLFLLIGAITFTIKY